MVTVLKTEVYGYGSWYSLKSIWSLHPIETFFRVLNIYGRGRHLGHVNQTQGTNFRYPYSLRLHMKFGFGLPSGF